MTHDFIPAHNHHALKNKRLGSFSSVCICLVILSTVSLLTGCEQTTPKPDTTQTTPTEKLVYRPKVKLTTTDPDPSVLKKFLAARELIYQARYDEARAQLVPLAEAGYTDAQLAMAHSYMPHTITNITKPTKFDWEQGIPWLIRAADGGNARAQWLLGDWYYHGSPGRVKRDYATTEWDKVKHYLHAASEQGLGIAQLALAGLYDTAHGVPMNEAALNAHGEVYYVKAYMWYTLASQRFAEHDGVGIDGKGVILSLRDKLARNRLTEAQIVEGERLVAQWTRTHPDAYQVEEPPELYP